MLQTRRTAKLLSLIAGATVVVGLTAGAAQATDVPDVPDVSEIGIPPIVDPCIQYPVICDGGLTTPTTDPTPTTVPEETGEPVPEAPPAVVVQATPNFTG